MGLAGFECVDFPTYLEMMDQDRIIFGVGSVEINEKLVGNSACLVQVAQSPDFPQTAFMPCANPTLWDGSRNTPMASCYCSWLGVWLSETSFCGLRKGLPKRDPHRITARGDRTFLHMFYPW